MLLKTPKPPQEGSPRPELERVDLAFEYESEEVASAIATFTHLLEFSGRDETMPVYGKRSKIGESPIRVVDVEDVTSRVVISRPIRSKPYNDRETADMFIRAELYKKQPGRPAEAIGIFSFNTHDYTVVYRDPKIDAFYQRKDGLPIENPTGTYIALAKSRAKYLASDQPPKAEELRAKFAKVIETSEKATHYSRSKRATQRILRMLGL